MVLARKFALVGFAAVVMLSALLAVPAAAQDDECYPVPPGGCVTETPTPTCEDILADPALQPEDVPAECQELCEDLIAQAEEDDTVEVPAACQPEVEVDCSAILADPSLGPDDLPDECIEDCRELAAQAAEDDSVVLPEVCADYDVLSETGFPTGTIVVAMAILFGFGLPMLLMRRRTT